MAFHTYLDSLEPYTEQRALVDPISRRLMTEPVRAADGRHYERATLEQWLAHRAAKGLPCTSPCTGQPMGEAYESAPELLREVSQLRDAFYQRRLGALGTAPVPSPAAAPSGGPPVQKLHRCGAPAAIQPRARRDPTDEPRRAIDEQPRQVARCQ